MSMVSSEEFDTSKLFMENEEEDDDDETETTSPGTLCHKHITINHNNNIYPL